MTKRRPSDPLVSRSVEAALNSSRLLNEQAALLERRRLLRRDNVQLMRDIAAAGRQFCDLIGERIVNAEVRVWSLRRKSPDASSPEPI